MDAKAYTTLIVSRDGPVARIVMNRPEARNALSALMVRELADAFVSAREDPEIRAVLLSGADGNFCAGGDLKGMGSADALARAPLAIAAQNRRFGELLELIDALSKAVIALVEGAAMGGGVGLIAVSDWAIAERGARIGTPEVTAGIVPAQIAPFLLARIGYAQARRMASCGLRLTAEEALRCNLIHEVADGAADLSAKGMAALNQCLRCAPAALAATKHLVRTARREPLGPTLDAAARAFAIALAGEGREGTRAFIEKRAPTWAEKITRG
jgi:isohexenylglutaconyl-CoA hydratase